MAVRSSVAGEDGAEHAFPGMMDSFLNVRNERQLWQAVADVVDSAWSERARAYRQEKQISGVAFTVNPTYPNEMAVHTVISWILNC